MCPHGFPAVVCMDYPPTRLTTRVGDGVVDGHAHYGRESVGTQGVPTDKVTYTRGAPPRRAPPRSCSHSAPELRGKTLKGFENPLDSKRATHTHTSEWGGAGPEDKSLVWVSFQSSSKLLSRGKIARRG